MRPHLFATAAVLGLVAGLAPAADPTPMNDIILARSALTAIDADPQLREVNLIVSVVDRVAVIGGPVATAEVGKRAETVVRGVTGIADVKNRCFVQEKPDPLLKAVADRLAASPRPLLAELPGVALPLTPRSGATSEATPRPNDTGFAMLTPPAPTLPVAGPVETVVVASRPPILDVQPASGFLGTPGSSGAARLTSTGTLTPAASNVFPARPKDVLASADAVRKADARFASLTAEMKDGTLVVGGKAPTLSDAWDFAQSLRRVPGVSRVVVGAVGVK